MTGAPLPGLREHVNPAAAAAAITFIAAMEVVSPEIAAIWSVPSEVLLFQVFWGPLQSFVTFSLSKEMESGTLALPLKRAISAVASLAQRKNRCVCRAQRRLQSQDLALRQLSLLVNTREGLETPLIVLLTRS